MGREKVKWLNQYNSSQTILLVGEGDFSFSACLARTFGSATNMVSTSFDSEDELYTKHWSSEAHLEELQRLGCVILHEVDVYDMHHDPTLKNIKFDRIVFNFPHAGHYPDLCERHTSLIKMHKELVSNFFASASKMIKEDGGEVHLTHRDDYPYDRWKIVKLANKAGLALLEKVEFRKADYPGYHNKRGGGVHSNKTFPTGDCFTFRFALMGTCYAKENQKFELSDDSDTDDICELLEPLRIY